MTPAKLLTMMGSKPKNETSYNPLTWVEWEMHTASSADANGLKLVASGSADYARILTSIKPSAKYGLLYNVIESSATLRMSNRYTGSEVTIPNSVGAQKYVFTTQPTISENQLRLFILNSATDGTYVLLKDIRLFELPAGSQIESDFDTLTADQLNAKYPF